APVAPVLAMQPAPSAAPRPQPISASTQSLPVSPSTITITSGMASPVTANPTRIAPLPSAAQPTTSLNRSINGGAPSSVSVSPTPASGAPPILESPYGASTAVELKKDSSAVANAASTSTKSAAPPASFATPYGGLKSTEVASPSKMTTVSRATPYG